MYLPGLRFHLFWLSRGSGFMCFGITCEVSPTLAFPWLRFHMFWYSGLRFYLHWLSKGLGFISFGVSPGLGFICYGILYMVSLVLALLGFRFHMFWLSR